MIGNTSGAKDAVESKLVIISSYNIHHMLIRPNLLGGEDWQKYVLRLLALRYGFNLVIVPDAHGGDFGLEAFSRDGCAYQCYAPQELLTTPELYKRQREKVTDDIGKFINNRKELIKLFGQTTIHKWILVVQEHRSAKLTQHCEEKAHLVRTLSDPLPYVSDDFDVMVVTEDYFPVEVSTLLGGAGIKVEVGETFEITSDAVSDWAQKNDELVKRMDDKLEPLPTFASVSDRRAARDNLLEMYIVGANSLQELKRKYPVIHERFEMIKRLRARSLRVDSKIQSLTIAGTRREFATELTERVGGLGAGTAETLSYAAIAEWLMVCPLNPRG